MACIFLYAGYNKASNPMPTLHFVEHLGLPGAVAYLVILLELGSGTALVLGAYTRIAALLLSGFCVLTALIVHFHPDDPEQMLHFMKNICMAGGFLVLFVQGSGDYGIGRKCNLKWS